MHRPVRLALAVASAAVLAACSSVSSGAPATASLGPAAGAAESPGSITISVLHGAVTESWPRVPGADEYVLTATGAATVRLPADRHSYRWPAPRIPSDLTAATVGQRRYTVTATARGTVLRRLTYLQGCSSTTYVAARGSGQNGLQSEAYAAGLGSLGAALLTDLRKDVGHDQWSLPAIAVAYPATAVAVGDDLLSLARFLHDYQHSVAVGVADTVRIVTRTTAACPHTRVVLFGFSQGAQVIGSAFARLAPALRNRVADVVLFADPQYRPDDPRVTYLPSRLSHDGILGARPAFATGGHTVLRSWCWREDVVCQQPPAGTQFHGPIYNSYAPLAARLLARTLR